MSSSDMKKVAHPLANRWTLFWDQTGTKKKDTSEGEWDDSLNEIYTFDTVEDFWSVYNNVKTPSILDAGNNFRLFRSDIEPKWEDPANEKGGRWTINIPQQAGRKELLDKYWLNAVLSCIGGRLDSDNQICGLVVSIKKAQDRISIWTRTSSDAAGVKAIGRRLKVDMGLPENVSISYAPHFSSTAARGKTSIYEV